MRSFIVSTYIGNGEEKDSLFVKAESPFRAAVLYFDHLFFKKDKIKEISVMEIRKFRGSGIGTAMHTEGDLYYKVVKKSPHEYEVQFDAKASEYASDEKTETGDWHVDD